MRNLRVSKCSAVAMWGILVCWALSCAAQTNRIAIFVTAPTREGFIDTTKDIQDSVKDVRGRLAHMKEFKVTDDPHAADVILIVAARGIGSNTYGQRINYTEYYGDATLTSEPLVANTYWVSTVMQVGHYRKEFLGAYTPNLDLGGNWLQCALEIAKGVRSWAKANAAQLASRRNQ